MRTSWVESWRGLVAPRLSDAALEALRDGLWRDDGRIRQGLTALPASGPGPIQAGDPVVYALWQAGEVHTPAGAVRRWAELMGDAGAVVEFIDTTPREWVVNGLRYEVGLELAKRKGAGRGAA
jgi:hypothetical protein